MTRHIFSTLAVFFLMGEAFLFTAPREQTQPFIFSHELEKPGITKVRFAYNLEPNNHILVDTISFMLDHQEAAIVSWKIDTAHEHVDKKTNQSNSVLSGSGVITISIKHPVTCTFSRGTLIAQFSQTNEKEPVKLYYDISFATHKPTSIKGKPELAALAAQEASQQRTCFFATLNHYITQASSCCSSWLENVDKKVSKTVQQASSPTWRLIFIFILGILMSFTPCIYPMIPITIGILQSAVQTSILRNFLLAATYSAGIATTFAILGLLAASGSAHFGQLIGNPFFVGFLVLFLSYFAFSMFGFYEIRLPRFLQSRETKNTNGSISSAFIFGALSGTIASPCLSPGLLLLLSIVATLGSKLLGFLYLFVFGIGLCVPLLLIGTFSNTSNILPRAGYWMNEIKIIFGLLLLGLCFYYLKALLPLTIFYTSLAGILLFSGAFLIFSMQRFFGLSLRIYRYCFGFILMSAGLVSLLNAFKVSIEPLIATKQSCDSYTYQDARSKAIREKKLLFLEFGANWCTSCKAINEKIMHNPKAHEVLSCVVLVSIDCSNPNEEASKKLLQQFKVFGFPTILLIDPETEAIITHWGSELLSKSLEEIAEEIKTKTTNS